ncbi:sphingomyelin phosphodiesterase [Mycena leptocephala]|nr:sphingomyelin phosphodiesterase [Mycena leptocephala]
MYPFLPLILLPFAFALKFPNPDDIIDGLKNAVDCDSCHSLLVPLKTLAELGDSAFVQTLTATCKVFKLEDEDVCVGSISEQGPILAHALRSISVFGKTATKLCEGTFGLCQAPAVSPYTIPLPKASRPASAARMPFASTGKTPFQVVHFSDVHVDRNEFEAQAGSDANCKKPICCRNFADEIKPPSEPAGPFGNRNCDSPVGLAKSMLEEISAHHTWSIFTGDVAEAAVWSRSDSGFRSINRELGAALNGPVFPTIGNHDAAPVNNFPLDATASVSTRSGFLIWRASMGVLDNRTAAREVKHSSGSYSVTAPGTNLRIISINTVYWYKQNFWLYDSDTPKPDPRGILEFTANELQAAEDAGQRAWIIGHMPPGSQDAFSDQSNYYDQIVQRYRHTIAGQFFGHTHVDEFQIAYSDYEHRGADTAVGVSWIAPALTPRSGNPAFRVYDVDPDTYEIMDSKVYMSDLKNPTYQTKRSYLISITLPKPDGSVAEWKLYYSAREEYGPLVDLAPTAPLDARFWHAVTEAFEKNDTAFQRYNEFMTRGAHVQPCNAACKKAAICQMRAARAEDNCQIVEPGLTFGDTERDPIDQTVMKAPAGSPAHPQSQCEGTGVGYLLSRLIRELATAPELEKLMADLKSQLHEIIPAPRPSDEL